VAGDFRIRIVSTARDKEADMRIGIKVLASATCIGVSMGLSGCITDKMVLTNDRGQTQTCEVHGHVGIVSPIVTHERYKHCVDTAKANGFKETPAATPPS
jgi:hypothetical protein